MSSHLRLAKEEAAAMESRLKAQLEDSQAQLKAAQERFVIQEARNHQDQQQGAAGSWAEESDSRKTIRALEAKLEEVRGRLRLSEIEVHGLQDQLTRRQKPHSPEDSEAVSTSTRSRSSGLVEGVDTVHDRLRLMEEELVVKTEEAVAARREAVILKVGGRMKVNRA